MNDVEPHVTTIKLEHSASHDLRRLADFLDACSANGIPVGNPSEISFFDLGGTEQERTTIVRLAKALGTFKKEFHDTAFFLKKDFGAVSVQFVASRSQICERVVVDKIEVPEKTIPAHTREVIEWRCPGPLRSLDVEPQALEAA